MMTAEQLKSSILRQAMQGKLVEQRIEEGTGREVYLNLKQEQKKLISIGQIKEKHLLGEIKTSEIEFDIPDTWVWARIEECGYFISGYTPKSDQLSCSGEIPYFKVSDMNAPGNEKFLCKTKKYLLSDIDNPRTFEEGTIVYPKNGGAVFTNKKRILAQASIVDLNTGGYKPSKSLDFGYVYLLYSMIDFRQCYKGTALPTIDMDKLREKLFPIPPFAEQKRIVAKIEELMPFVEQYAAASTKLDTLNTSFPDMMKKSILQEAVQGRLVPQDPSEGTGEELYKQIQTEKNKLINEGKIKKDKPLIDITEDEVPFAIPDNWTWARFGNLGSYKKGPFGSALTKSMFVTKGPNAVKVYEQKNAIQKDSTLGEYYITRDYFKSKMSGFEVHPGDIIVSCAGTIGETYVLPDGIEQGIINQALMRMQVFKPMYIPYFLTFFDVVLKQNAKSGSKGSAIKNIPPFDVLKNYPVPIPPLAEQKRIVAKIKEVLSLCEKMD